jgi:hypothetical protein
MAMALALWGVWGRPSGNWLAMTDCAAGSEHAASPRRAAKIRTLFIEPRCIIF